MGGGGWGGRGTGAGKLPRDSGRAGEIPTWRALLLALYKRCQPGSANPPRDATSYSCMFYMLLCGCIDCPCRASGGERATPPVGVGVSCLLCNAATPRLAALLVVSHPKNPKHLYMTWGRSHILSSHQSRPVFFFFFFWRCCLLVCFSDRMYK